jgi:hypothetical protein
MNEIILAPCDAGYVQSCTGFKNSWRIHRNRRKVYKLQAVKCGGYILQRQRENKGMSQHRRKIVKS